MLVLTRKNKERVVMVDDRTGETMQIVVDKCNAGACRLMIDAPKHWRIIREELIGDRRAA